MPRIAHLSDLHLGRRQYYRTTPHGVNQREADTSLAFRRAVDGVVAATPDLILIPGDVFHSRVPSNLARLEATRQIKRLVAVAPVLLLPGNHDTARSVETGSPIPVLGEIPGVIVAEQDQGRAVFDRLGVGVCLMPHAVVLKGEKPAIGDQPIELLLIHGATPGLRGPAGVIDGMAAPFDPAAGTGFAYVALGDYHVCRQVAANAWYSGSLEYVSSDPWSEMKERNAKGWLLVTLERGAAPIVEFQPVATRPHLDLPPIDGTGLTPAEVVSAIQREIPASWDGIVARQIVTGATRLNRRGILSAEPIRKLQLHALHFKVDVPIERRTAQPINAPLILDEREPWEIEQEREAAYWDGREGNDEGPLPVLPAAYDPMVDPYALTTRSV